MLKFINLTDAKQITFKLQPDLSAADADRALSHLSNFYAIANGEALLYAEDTGEILLLNTKTKRTEKHGSPLVSVRCHSVQHPLSVETRCSPKTHPKSRSGVPTRLSTQELKEDEMTINFSELIEKYNNDFMHWMGNLEGVHFGKGFDPECQMSRAMVLYFEKHLDLQLIQVAFEKEGPEVIELDDGHFEFTHTLKTLAFGALFHHQHILKKPPVQVFTDPRLHEIAEILSVERVCFLSAIHVEVMEDHTFSLSFVPKFWVG